jgi:hypothetical protein
MRDGKRSFLRFTKIGTVLSFITPIIAFSQSQSVKTEDLIKNSDVIVVGKVGRMVSEWNEDKSRILTRVTISVDQTLKGPGTDNAVTVTIPGGEVDGIGEWYSHTARFADQEDVVVFAERDKKGRFRVSGGEQGKISVQRDKATGALMIPNFGPLDQFTGQVQSVVKAQETETLQKK